MSASQGKQAPTASTASHRQGKAQSFSAVSCSALLQVLMPCYTAGPL
jgi:hypothetical protein